MRRALIVIAAMLAASCSGSSTAPSSTAPALLPNVTVTPAPTQPAPAPVVRDPARFDQTFWNAFVHDGWEHPTAQWPLQRLTAAPSIYLRTVDEAGHAIDAVTLNATAQAIRDVAPQWTGGAFGVAGLTQGTDTKAGVRGWITVTWDAQPTSYCGISDIGLDGGTIRLATHTANCGCPPSVSTVAIRPRTVKHELGHAFGYYHTGNAADLMSGLAVSECDREPSAREMYHAGLAYQSPIGTTTALPISSGRSIIID